MRVLLAGRASGHKISTPNENQNGSDADAQCCYQLEHALPHLPPDTVRTNFGNV